MRSRHTNPNLGRAGKSFPTLEPLEDRSCPSSISLSGPILTINGDNTSDNLITVLDGGQGNVTASVRDANGHVTSRSLTGVTGIAINTAGGNDTVNYALTAPLTTSESLSVNLGNGNNQVNLDYSRGVTAPALTVRVLGGSGDDRLNATLGPVKDTAVDFRTALGNGNDQVFESLNGDLTGSARLYFQNVDGSGYDGIRFTGAGNIAPTASLQVDSLGGANPDTFHVDYSGQLDGRLAIHTTGGPRFSWIESDINLAPGSTGALDARLLGGLDLDALLLRVNSSSHHLGSLSAVMDGGGGQNLGIATPNVHVLRTALN
jgi:hypothetical protein